MGKLEVLETVVHLSHALANYASTGYVVTVLIAAAHRYFYPEHHHNVHNLGKCHGRTCAIHNGEGE